MDLEKQNFFVGDVSGIKVEGVHSSDYGDPRINQSPTTKKNGHLWLFRIEPRRADLPIFVARIGHDDHQAVDIDCEGDESARKAFALSKAGYAGHKTTRISSDPCQYKVHIEIPTQGVVFSGTLTIATVGIAQRARDALDFEDGVASKCD